MSVEGALGLLLLGAAIFFVGQFAWDKLRASVREFIREWRGDYRP